MDIVFYVAAVQVLGVGALLFAQARHYDKIVAHFEGLARGGVVVQMDKTGTVKAETQSLTVGQKRRLLEAAASKRAARRRAQ